jgi:hypothetical protein
MRLSTLGEPRVTMVGFGTMAKRRKISHALAMLAWVAWVHSTLPSKGIDDWTPSGSAETLAECKQTAETAAENGARKFKSGRGTVVAQQGAALDVTFASGERGTIVFVCLPENIDPRPKER